MENNVIKPEQRIAFQGNLSMLMKRNKVDREKLSAETGIPRKNIDSWFYKSKSYPTPEEVKTLANYFSVLRYEIIAPQSYYNNDSEKIRKIKNNFGTLLDEALEKRHMSKTRLSEILGITYTTLKTWTDGKRFPPKKYLDVISRELDIPLEKLLEGSFVRLDSEEQYLYNYLFMFINSLDINKRQAVFCALSCFVKALSKEENL